jgi:hypothetical protein
VGKGYEQPSDKLRDLLVAVNRFKHYFKASPIKVPLRMEGGKAA